jgi:ABC-type phosphate transport system substrate-binding protein
VKPKSILPARFAALLGLALLLGIAGCGKSQKATSLAEQPAPKSPNEAARQLDQVFATAAPEVKQNATLAATAMRTGDYEKAVASLQYIRSTGNQTLEQGLAIHNSAVTLEHRLIAAMEAGDPNAKRAYQLLKELKRD